MLVNKYFVVCIALIRRAIFDNVFFHIMPRLVFIYLSTCFYSFYTACDFNRFHADSPGVVHIKETADAEEKSFRLFKPNINSDLLPRVVPAPIPPPGLDGPRQEYLYRHIREFVEDPWKDVMCPLPGTVFPLTPGVQLAPQL